MRVVAYLNLGKLLVLYLMKEGFLPSKRECPEPSCKSRENGKFMSLYQSPSYPDGCYWRCDFKNKKKNKKCYKQLSIRTDTWFEHSRLTLPEIKL